MGAWVQVDSHLIHSGSFLLLMVQRTSANIAERRNLHPSFLIEIFSSFRIWEGERFFFLSFNLDISLETKAAKRSCKV